MDKNIIFIFVIVCCVLLQPCKPLRYNSDCALGYMTDVQSWVGEQGQLTAKVDKLFAIDLSSSLNLTSLLQTQMNRFGSQLQYAKYLSLARCNLVRVPTAAFAHITDSQNRVLADTLEYLSLYGNRFIDTSVPGESYDVMLSAENASETNLAFRLKGNARALWINGFQHIEFKRLRELDLRACMIETLVPSLFRNMPQLEALYLGENAIKFIGRNAFLGLNNLVHLDMSRNEALDNLTGSPVLFDIEDINTFKDLSKLTSLDFSHVKLSQRAMLAVRNLGPKVERLSLCDIGRYTLPNNFFKNMNLKILDLSDNNGMMTNLNVLSGLEDSLRVLQAHGVGLQSIDLLHKFEALEFLGITRNEISLMSSKTAAYLPNLKVLDLRRNRFGSWFNLVFTYMKSLQVLMLDHNNLNLFSHEMLHDFANISYLSLSENSIVCNCNSKAFIEIAARNEFVRTDNEITDAVFQYDFSSFHTGFKHVNRMIEERENASSVCSQIDCFATDWGFNGDFLLLDFRDENSYICLMLPGNEMVPYTEDSVCEISGKSNIEVLDRKRRQLLLILLPCILLPALFVGFVFRRNLRYCYVTMRNSAMLSMVNKNKVIDDDTIFNYDVFVSYCNDDRTWVLDHLLGHLENDCSVSLCLHERDFQVGLSILENIVSCMDRSKFIMLVISQQFLLSQWCQFEMHLAQHRLLETRREDLILILLEDIPRRLRPNTLHYLMLTKTYIVWPKNKSEQHLFWKRLKKSVVTQKQKQNDNVSLA